MLSSARFLREFPERLVAARLSRVAEGCNRLLAQALGALHAWQVGQAEREIHRYRHLARSTSN
jgi:hypothetical protein